MDIVDSGEINLLDKIRYGAGRDILIDNYNNLVKNNLKMAVTLINNENMSFTTLFLLEPVINKIGIQESLSIRNKMAVDFINEISAENKRSTPDPYLTTSHIQSVYSVMKWILETGYLDDGINDRFDELMDTAAAVLTKEYRDRSILPVVSEMIFKRNRRGFFMHDLIWAFFESRNARSLIFIANGLLSEEQKDVELACSLLCFIPGVEDKTSPDEKYAAFINWIEENNMFLCYKGESFQATRKPLVYSVNLEAKYLCKMVSIDTGEILKPLNEKECELLDRFRILDEDSKKLLSGFSLTMHRRSVKQWNDWIKEPISSQLRTARSGGLFND